MTTRNKSEIILAIPSKGSLYEGTLGFLRLAGIPVVYENQRQYTARMSRMDGISILFQRAEEIPMKIASGAADLGITGEDLFREETIEHDNPVIVIRDLGFGHARLVVAVPGAWIDVNSMDDLAELAHSFRLKHQRTLRIATKFPNLAREFLAQKGLSDYMLIESLGATESAPSSGMSDLIIDLASSGKTLTENHLKMLSDGVIISSQACLIATRRIENWDRARIESFEMLLDILESYLRGKNIYNIQASVSSAKIGELSMPTNPWRLAYSIPITQIDSPGNQQDSFVVIRITCPQTHLHDVVRRLRDSGAEEIIVTQPAYVFSKKSERFHQFLRLLKKSSALE